MATLTTEERDALPDSDFVYPDRDPREYPINDVKHGRDALSRVAANGTPAEQDKVRAAVHRRYPQLAKMEKAAFVARLIKSETPDKFYGIVGEPDLTDSQGDKLSTVELEKAAHEFMLDYAASPPDHEPDVQHTGIRAHARLLENYIAPADTTLAGEPITKGAWVQAWLIEHDLTKQEIEDGEIDGLSLEGFGVRTAVAA